MAILVTGGAGYIGSHTVLVLLEQNHEVVVIDNLCNASSLSLSRIEKLTGRAITFYQGDIQDQRLLEKIFTQHTIEAVIHFAGLKAVGESTQQPVRYYQNNVTGTLTLLAAMHQAGVYKLIFSSSATVYGASAEVPYRESQPTGGTTNPYGTSKLMVEHILQDVAKMDHRYSFISLRYFNPIGAHSSGQIGEDPCGIPNNLLPYIAQVAVGKLDKLSIFGADYPTIDGTGVRDYIHVMDLAEGHVQALDNLKQQSGFYAYNLGTGRGYSVLEVVKAFEQATGKQITYQIIPRRAGDLAAYWADVSLAAEKLQWRASRDLAQMMADTWNWQKNNPEGFR